MALNSPSLACAGPRLRTNSRSSPADRSPARAQTWMPRGAWPPTRYPSSQPSHVQAPPRKAGVDSGGVGNVRQDEGVVERVSSTITGSWFGGRAPRALTYYPAREVRRPGTRLSSRNSCRWIGAGQEVEFSWFLVATLRVIPLRDQQVVLLSTTHKPAKVQIVHPAKVVAIIWA